MSAASPSVVASSSPVTPGSSRSSRSLVVPRPAAPWPMGGTRVPSSRSCFRDLDRTLARVVYEQRETLATLFHKFSSLASAVGVEQSTHQFNRTTAVSASSRRLGRSLVAATTPTKPVGALLPQAPVIAEQPFVDLARHCNLSPTLLSHGELFEIYKLAYSTDSGSSMGLTFPGFCYALCRCALAVFSGARWDDVYHTRGSKLRLFLFWIEQGIASGRARRSAIGALKFPGNAGRLMDVLESPQSNILAHYTTLNASQDEFVRGGVTFSQVDYEIGGMHLKTPFLLPHVAKLDRALQRLFHWFVCPGGAGGQVSHTNPAMMTSSMFARFVRACKLRGPSMTSGLIDIVFKVVTTGDTTGGGSESGQNNGAGAGTSKDNSGGHGRGVHGAGRSRSRAASRKKSGASARSGTETWKENSFTRRSAPVSMVNRKMSYETFYVALADLAIRKYVKGVKNHRKNSGKGGGQAARRPSAAMLAAWAPGMSTTRVSGETVRTALHSLLVGDILPLLARFWHKVGLDKTECTAVVAGSPRRKRELREFGDSVGRTPEKRAAGWKQRWLVVSDLESLMSSATVLRAFHIDTAIDVSSKFEQETAAETTTLTADGAFVVDPPSSPSATAAAATAGAGTATEVDEKNSMQEEDLASKTASPLSGAAAVPTLSSALIYVSQDAAAITQKRKQEAERKRLEEAERRRRRRRPYRSIATRRALQGGDEKEAQQKEPDLDEHADVATCTPEKGSPATVAVSSPVSPERVVEIMHELTSLQSLLAQVGDTTAGMEVGLDASSLPEMSIGPGEDEESVGTRLMKMNAQGKIVVPPPAGAEAKIPASSPSRELRAATQANVAKDRELATILNSVREKLRKLKSSIGHETHNESGDVVPTAPSVSDRESMLPPPPAGTPGTTTRLDAARAEGGEKRNSTPARPINSPAPTKSSMLREKISHGQMQAPESSFVFPRSERSMPQGSSAMSLQDISSPAPTKSSILRERISHGQAKAPESSFAFPRPATSVRRDRRGSMMTAEPLEQQWAAGRRVKHSDSERAGNAGSEKRRQRKKTANAMVPPPHIQRRMRRISQGLPEKRVKSHIYITTPLCGYSSFSRQGSKFGNGDVVMDASPNRRNRSRKRNANSRKNILKEATARIQRRAAAAATTVGLDANSSKVAGQAKSKGTENGNIMVSVPEGTFEKVFDQELTMRAVNLEYVAAADQMEGRNLTIVSESDMVVHCRVLLSRRVTDGNLKTVRVLLTRPLDDAFFHFRHFCDQQLFDSLKGKLSLDVGFEGFPATLNEILASSLDPSQQTGLVLAMHADGRARLQALKTLFGAKKVEVLSLNFLRSPEAVVRQYANALLSESRASNATDAKQENDSPVSYLVGEDED
jgi:hypothetical protein